MSATGGLGGLAAAASLVALAALVRRGPRSVVAWHWSSRSATPASLRRPWLRSSWRVRSLLPSHAIEPSPTSDVVRLRAAIASGASVLGAFERVGAGDGPWSASARSLVATAHAGLPLAAALRRWSAGGEERALVADALLIAGSTGGSQVRALDAAAATLAERRALQREIRALAAQASASAAVLVAAPVAFALGVALLDDRVRRFYTGSLAGLGCVIAGALLDAAGGWWMVRLVRSVR